MSMRIYRYRVTWHDGFDLIINAWSADDAAALAGLTRYHDGIGNPFHSTIRTVELEEEITT